MAKQDSTMYSPTAGVGRQVARILEALLVDQSTSGTHKGQFGASVSLSESEQYGDKEDMETKPRMYMTRWPCLVLGRYRLAPLAVAFAVENVTRLFSGGRILGRDAYAASRVDRPQRIICNFRHTMCGALLLLEQTGWNQITRRVLGEMLDAADPWQVPCGGWKGVSSRSEADLFASLYAIRLLNAVILLGGDAPGFARDPLEPLHRSLDYLERQWDKNGWQFSDLSSEETFPQAFIEISDVISRHRPRLHQRVVARLLDQLNSTGGLSASYKQKSDPLVSEERHHARLAYATYLAEQPFAVWGSLAGSALSGRLDRMYAAELAFSLDMSKVAQSNNLVIPVTRDA